MHKIKPVFQFSYNAFFAVFLAQKPKLTYFGLYFYKIETLNNSNFTNNKEKLCYKISMN